MAGPSVAVTVVTGFLGAGKTTLVNDVLTRKHGKRIAVICNEFGDEMGIESSMMVDSDGKPFDEWFELPNGCLCCTVRDDLVVTVERLMKKRDKFDHILVETTGLADPGPVASVFWVDDELDSPLFLNGIVTVVDAKHIQKQLEEEAQDGADVNEAQRQIAFADLVLANKRDLVSEADMKGVVDSVRSINATAKVVETQNSVVDLDAVLDIGSLQDRSAASATLCAEGACDHDHHRPNHLVQRGIGTVSVQIPANRPIRDAVELERWFGQLIWEPADGFRLYRAKAVLNIAGAPRRHVLQAVGEVFDVHETTPWEDGADKTSRFVFIGKGLDRAALEASLQQVLA